MDYNQTIFQCFDAVNLAGNRKDFWPVKILLQQSRKVTLRENFWVTHGTLAISKAGQITIKTENSSCITFCDNRAENN